MSATAPNHDQSRLGGAAGALSFRPELRMDETIHPGCSRRQARCPKNFQAGEELTGLDGARQLRDDGLGVLHAARSTPREQPDVLAARNDAQVLHGCAVLDDSRDAIALAAREHSRLLRGDLRVAPASGAL